MFKYLICLSVLFLFHTCSTNGDDRALKTRSNQRELLYLQILSTNGHFAPLWMFPNDENLETDWSDGVTLLTKLGKLQMFEVGKLIRKRYSHFITSNPGEVDAFSAADDRSTVSLLSICASLYAPTKEWQFVPGFRWQPVTISYMDKYDIFFSFNDICLKLYTERDELLASQFYQDHVKKDKFLYEFWSQNSNATIMDWADVAYLYDLIGKEDAAGLKVPRWARMHLENMKRISDMAYTYNYKSNTSLALKIGSLIELIILRMKVKVLPMDPSPEIKTSVYVTHDWNLAALMSAMRLSNGLRPPPAATLVFEMHREPNDQLTVRTLFFNSTHPERGYQEPHVLVLPGCSDYCPLDTFADFFQYVIPKNYLHLCGAIVTPVEDITKDEEEESSPATLYPLFEDLKIITTTTTTNATPIEGEQPADNV